MEGDTEKWKHVSATSIVWKQDDNSRNGNLVVPISCTEVPEFPVKQPESRHFDRHGLNSSAQQHLTGDRDDCIPKASSQALQETSPRPFSPFPTPELNSCARHDNTKPKPLANTDYIQAKCLEQPVDSNNNQSIICKETHRDMVSEDLVGLDDSYTRTTSSQEGHQERFDAPPVEVCRRRRVQGLFIYSYFNCALGNEIY